MGPSLEDSCNSCYMGSALEIMGEVEGQILEVPPSLIPFWHNLSCQLLPMDTVMQPRICSTQALIMIASAFFVDQAFEATEIQKILKAFT